MRDRRRSLVGHPLLSAAVGVFWFCTSGWASSALLAPAQVWTLANFLWTTREAKRLFGMLGSGGILGGIFAGFVSARMTSSFGAESLLLLMAIPLASAAWVVIAVWETAARRPRRTRSVVTDSGPQNLMRQSAAYRRVSASARDRHAGISFFSGCDDGRMADESHCTGDVCFQRRPCRLLRTI